MAFSLDSGGGGGRNKRFRGTSTISEMNVVPLVDVVLVLLIIFMLTAQVMEFGLEVEVPKVKQERQSAQELPVLTVTRGGEIYLNEAAVNINTIAVEVRKRFGEKTDAVYLRADKAVIWDSVAQVISALNEAKLQVRVVTKPEDEADRRR